MNAAAIRLLIAKGLDASDIAEVAEALERKKDPTNAERQARHRASKRNTVTVTRDPLLEEIITPEQSSPDGDACLPAKPAKRSTPAHFMPDGWEPTLTPAAQRLVDGWPPGMYDRQLSAFRNHAADKGRKSRDWDAAFRTWLDNADKWKPKDDRQSSRNDEIQNPYARIVAARQAHGPAAVGG